MRVKLAQAVTDAGRQDIDEGYSTPFAESGGNTNWESTTFTTIDGLKLKCTPLSVDNKKPGCCWNVRRKA